MSYRFADSLQAGSGWNCGSILILLASCQQWHTPLLCVQWKTLDDGQRNCPKHVEFHSKNKIWEIFASSWFYYKKFNTMQGHMNVKFVENLWTGWATVSFWEGFLFVELFDTHTQCLYQCQWRTHKWTKTLTIRTIVAKHKNGKPVTISEDLKMTYPGRNMLF